jgi:hypothetical protein
VDDLIQVLFFLLIVIFGLLSGSKKKKTDGAAPRARAQRPDRTAELARRPREAVAQRSLPAEAPRPVQTRKDLEASLYDLLFQREVEVEEPTAEREMPADDVLPDEAKSLETLTAAGGESHRRFHERYLSALHTPPTATRVYRRRLTHLDAHTLRDAVVWKEVLGRPKGLD